MGIVNITSSADSASTPSGSIIRSGVPLVWNTIRSVDLGDAFYVSDISTTINTAPSTPNEYTALRRGVMSFNTSTIPHGVPINSASITINVYYVGSGDTPLSHVLVDGSSLSGPLSTGFYTPDDPLAVTAATQVSNSLAGIIGAMTFTLNASGIALLSNPVAQFIMKSVSDLNNVEPSPFVLNDVYGIIANGTGVNAPVLSVNYSTPAVGFVGARVQGNPGARKVNDMGGIVVLMKLFEEVQKQETGGQ